MPLQATSGAASYDAFGGGSVAGPTYIEDVFSTWLTTGASANITVVNGIDLSGKGGMVWQKTRTSAGANTLFDTVRGVNKYLISNATNAEASASNILPTFNNNGFVIGTDNNLTTSGENGVSWTFRKQPKFFDVVTWTADSSGTGQAVPHNLGSIPGCIIVKATNASSNWFTWHIATGITVARTGFQLNGTAASALSVNSTGQMTSTEFFSGQLFDSSFDRPVTDGTTYVAYLFAHNAGGFGLTGTDNVISCGSFTTDGSGNATVNLGYEPQWVITKPTSASGSWRMCDTMRGWLAGPTISNQLLYADLSNAEVTTTAYNGTVNATGFNPKMDADTTFIYIAIRRGPMKVPTDATKVFKPVFQNGAGTVTTNFPVSLVVAQKPDSAGANWQDRLRGGSTNSYNVLYSYNTNAEASGTGAGYGFDNNNGYVDAFSSSAPRAYWNFQRAPSFFDEVCYTGDGAATRTLAHNLTVAPEWIILRKRNDSGYWNTFFNFGSTSCSLMTLDDTAASGSTSYTGNFSKMGGAPTSSSFFVTNPTFGETNVSGTTYVAYLFATCAGVSKVGSYTGNGTTQTINCGFTGGARFVLIKRTDSTGDWYTYDTARGMTTLTDPYLLLNSTAAETATLGSVTTVSTGFALNSAILAAINVNAGTYIFLAIA